MLKLLLSHWQVHREPAPFVLTDDPLYCAHLSTSVDKLPEVYSVNRVNPLFEEDTEGSNTKLYNHKRTLSENDTRSSDDTGYISGCRKSQNSLDDNDSLNDCMSSDSDEPAKSVIVSADVHRESNPEDIIQPSIDSSYSCCAGSLSSQSSSENLYDSLTTTNTTTPSHHNFPVEESSMKLGVVEQALQTEVKRPADMPSAMNSRDRVNRLMDDRTPSSSDSSTSSQETASPRDPEVEKTRTALMLSLTRAINLKKSKQSENSGTLTKSDSSTKDNKNKLPKISEAESTEANFIQSDVFRRKSFKDDEAEKVVEAVTRRDESISTNSASTSVSRHRRQRHHNNHHHHKHRDSVPKPITLHQLLPGHWSYDNVYLPQMPGVCYHCLHHHHGGAPYPLSPVPELDIPHPMFHHHPYHKSRSRHSWAAGSATPEQEDSLDVTPTSSSKDGTTSTSDSRCSPDGSSQESDSQPRSDKIRSSLQERRSLRVPKTCKCQDYFAKLDSEDDLIPRGVSTVPHACTCCYLPHRKVKFASDTDLTRHNSKKDGVSMSKKESLKLSNEKTKQSTFPINLHRLNGHVKQKTLTLQKEDVNKKLSTISRGKKEPIKVDEFYRTYPINFKDWEAHYRSKFLNKRRKRALNMMAMAIGIVLVIGVALAMTFIFLKLKKPT